MSTFTPGPWIISDEYRRPATHSTWIEISTHDSGLPIISCRFSNQEANARLIAAAPDMYEAVIFALNVLANCCAPLGGCDDKAEMLHARRMLKDAMLKAEGKS